MKAVLDTNVLAAAFVSDGLCRRLLLRARDRSFTLVISPFIRDEFAWVLRRKAGAGAGEIREALELIDEISASVPSDEQVRVFEPFFSTKPKGLGMGLAISGDIIVAHGGRLWAENNETGGATFTLSLPAAGGDAP